MLSSIPYFVVYAIIVCRVGNDASTMENEQQEAKIVPITMDDDDENEPFIDLL